MIPQRPWTPLTLEGIDMLAGFPSWNCIHSLVTFCNRVRWGGQDLNLRPTDYESAALTN